MAMFENSGPASRLSGHPAPFWQAFDYGRFRAGRHRPKARNFFFDHHGIESAEKPIAKFQFQYVTYHSSHSSDAAWAGHGGQGRLDQQLSFS
ncbi:MAG: hypothetical protein HC788_07685 [Sphingopyxis sp.]|nr:hypothetical protein [Sphingopyxis sp.]